MGRVSKGGGLVLDMILSMTLALKAAGALIIGNQNPFEGEEKKTIIFALKSVKFLIDALTMHVSGDIGGAEKALAGQLDVLNKTLEKLQGKNIESNFSKFPEVEKNTDGISFWNPGG